MDKNKENEETITITKSEYNRLIKADRWLDSLYTAGVDNWEGYGVAQDMRESE